MRILLSILLLCSCISLAFAESKSSEYQIDVILFQHPGVTDDSNETPLSSALPPNKKNTIPLLMKEACTTQLYCLQKLKNSTLAQSWYALSRNQDYHLLGHYSWRQPSNNTKAVWLPERVVDGIKIVGSLKIRNGNYYYFTSALYLYSSNNTSPLILQQHTRLKDNQTIYLDHPNVGMLVRIHKIIG